MIKLQDLFQTFEATYTLDGEAQLYQNVAVVDFGANILTEIPKMVACRIWGDPDKSVRVQVVGLKFKS